MSCKTSSEGKTRDCPEGCEFVAAQTSMMYSCLDPSSMRFIPLYHDSTTCEKRLRATYSLGGERVGPSFSLRFLPLYAAYSDLSPVISDLSPAISDLSPAIRDLSPARTSALVAREDFATSTPDASSASGSSRFFQPTKFLVQNTTDSGILMDSPSFMDSCSGYREKTSPVVSNGHGKTISILRRSQSSLDVLSTVVNHDAKVVKSSVSRDLISEFKKVMISEVVESSSDCPKQIERRSRKYGRRRTFQKMSSKESTISSRASKSSSYVSSGASKTKENSTASVIALPGPAVWDNNNNQMAEEYASSIAPKIRQLLGSNKPKPWCTFCESNNETKDVIRSHTLKLWEPRTRAYKMICPVLRSYVCPRCGDTGDKAHTYTYCPVVISEIGYRPKSLITKIKSTSHDSSGKKRDPTPQRRFPH